MLLDHEAVPGLIVRLFALGLSRFREMRLPDTRDVQCHFCLGVTVNASNAGGTANDIANRRATAGMVFAWKIGQLPVRNQCEEIQWQSRRERPSGN